MKKHLTAFLSLVCLSIQAQGLSSTQLRALKVNLASCSGNSVLHVGAIKSQLVTLGSDINNEKAIKFHGVMNVIYTEIGKSINGEDYDSIAKDFFDSRVKNFNAEKARLGIPLAKQNLLTSMLEKSDSCINLLNEQKNIAYASTILSPEQIKALRTHVKQNTPR